VAHADDIAADLVLIGERLRGLWLATSGTCPIGTPSEAQTMAAVDATEGVLRGLGEDEVADVGEWVVRRARRRWWLPFAPHRLVCYRKVSPAEIAGRAGKTN
jgi:hypothetical protein